MKQWDLQLSGDLQLLAPFRRRPFGSMELWWNVIDSSLFLLGLKRIRVDRIDGPWIEPKKTTENLLELRWRHSHWWLPFENGYFTVWDHGEGSGLFWNDDDVIRSRSSAPKVPRWRHSGSFSPLAIDCWAQGDWTSMTSLRGTTPPFLLCSHWSSIEKKRNNYGTTLEKRALSSTLFLPSFFSGNFFSESLFEGKKKREREREREKWRADCFVVGVPSDGCQTFSGRV